MTLTHLHVDFIAEVTMFNGTDVITEFEVNNYLESREFEESEIIIANDILNTIK